MTVSIVDRINICQPQENLDIENKKLLKLAMDGSKKMSLHDLECLYKLYPKIESWKPASSDSLFVVACLNEDAHLAMDLINEGSCAYLVKDLDSQVFKNLPTMFKGISPFKNSLGWHLLKLVYFSRNYEIPLKKILAIYREQDRLADLWEKNEIGDSSFRIFMKKTGIVSSTDSSSILLEALLGSRDQLEITWLLYNESHKHSQLLQEVLFSSFISVAYLGSHVHSGDHFARLLLKNEKNEHVPKISKLAEALSQAVSPAFQKLESLELILSSTDKEFFLGRTLVIPPKEKGGLCDAYKFAKEDESEAFLGLESVVIPIFAQHIDLKSKMPEPQGCYSLPTLPEHIASRTKRFSDGHYRVYHYKAPEDYFKYIHTIVDEDTDNSFWEAMFACIHDRVAQVREGVFPVIADIWHNTYEQYRFVPLSDYLAITRGLNRGMGRISRGFANIEWPNERFSGAADWVDFSLLFKILNHKIKDIRGIHRSKISSLQINALSELYLTYSLIVIYRLYKKGEINWQKGEYCLQLAKGLKTVFIRIFANYTNEDMDKVSVFANAEDIDWEMMAREISFWIDPTQETGYYSWVIKGELPKELYPHMDSRVMKGWFEECGTYNQFFRPGLGFCEDFKNQDFGPYGGPLGWTTFERALYKFCIFTYNIAEYKAVARQVV